MTIYRGYDIEKDAEGRYFWNDERGFRHDGEPGAKFQTEEEAMDAVDRYKRNMARAKQ